ncbi:MAG: winged helix-turn-helix domain-containing protein, partial [Burkholderia sp.]
MPLQDARAQLPSDEHFTLFGRFAVGRKSRRLWAEGKALAFNERATDLLIALIDAGGRIVSIEQLQQHVWPDSSVSANSVQALVSQLRNVLGDDRDVIETVPRRGYRFAAEWCDTRDEWVGPDGGRDAADPPRCEWHDMRDAGRHDERVAGWLDDDIEHRPLIGRDAELSELLMLAPKHRLITLTSPGGNGKTRLAREAALRTSALFPDGVAYIELADLTLPELIPEVIAAKILSLSSHASSGSGGLVEHLANRCMLLVVDHCDHLAQEVAGLVETLLSATGVGVIVCAEAPLFIAGECVLPVAPLRFGGRPASAAALDMPDASPSDACRLLVAQLESNGAYPTAGHVDTTPDRTRAGPLDATLESISRALSGNPLALALAARQIARALRSRTTLASAAEDWNARWRRLMQHRTGSHELAPEPATLVS